MTIHEDNVSTKKCLLSIARKLEIQASKDMVKPRKEAMEQIAKSLTSLANGRYVTRLLDYME